MRKVTIKDVAREAGVSISAVSKALNNSGEINEKTKENILNVAKHMNYIPNINGRNLKAKETKTIGLFVTSMTGNFFEILTDSALQCCERNGYDLNVFFYKNPETLVAALMNQRLDGSIILNPSLEQEHIELIKKYQLPVVFLDREESGKNIGSVLFDSYQEGETAAKYLLSLGHKEFGYVKGPDNNYDSIMRGKGFWDTVTRAGGQMKAEHFWQGLYNRDSSRAEISAFLSRGGKLPSAIFAANDYSAVGCMEALRSYGIVVPQEVSVMGCDNIDVAEFIVPALTTIQVPFDTMGRMAVEMVLDILRNGVSGSVKRIAGSIILRDSCYAARQ